MLNIFNVNFQTNNITNLYLKCPYESLKLVNMWDDQKMLMTKLYYENVHCDPEPYRGKTVRSTYFGVCPIDCRHKVTRPGGPPPGMGTDVIHVMEERLGFEVFPHEWDFHPRKVRKMFFLVFVYSAFDWRIIWKVRKVHCSRSLKFY